MRGTAFLPGSAARPRRQQALRARIPATAWDAMVHRGALDRVHRGVYRASGSARPPEQRLLAAVLRGGRGARIDGVLAAALHGLEGCDLDDRLTIVIPSDRRVTGVSFTVHVGPDVVMATGRRCAVSPP